MEAYKRWVRRNKEYVHSLESLANGLTWLLPERFSSSEIGPEAVTAILGVITAINEHIIDTAPSQIHTGHPAPSAFPYSLCISALKDLETLVEVVAQHYYGDTKKWNFIAATEAIKFLVRLAMFRNSGYRMLLQGGEIPNSEEKLEVCSSQSRHGDFRKPGFYSGPGSFRNCVGQNGWNLEGRALSALNRFGENARMVSDPVWLRRVQQQNAIMEPLGRHVAPKAETSTLSSILSEKGVHGSLYLMGEILFISRPLIYVLFIRKYGTWSWTPWFLSLAMDVFGVGIFSQVTLSGCGSEDRKFQYTTSEKDELKRRKLLWALYLMRDPFFSKYTRERLDRAERLLEPVPLFGALTAKVIELIFGAQTRYTYMSGS
ncbi:peroxisome biogenesis protein 16 isoform X1 [Rhodamnia argentea]|uniref:Peroxisomal membrane protein PEX16 n=1 Tax=Rhodamnia argentea TaxID=178133 RepID=A0A8B8Q1N8_9MYRT|nr:peroxisome biogenesis protein 16 isoform X1 [Rhodamnia argentea]